MKSSAGLCELSREEQFAIDGGNTSTFYLGFIYGLAFVGGLVAEPALAVIAIGVGVALIASGN